MSDRVKVRYLGASGSDPGSMSRDICKGLSSLPKDLSPWPKYFYDARGSELFEKITVQPEYYQTRSELSILENCAENIISDGGFGELVELGSGSSSKTRALLDPMSRSGRVTRYVPLDVSESAVEESAYRLLGEYPYLQVLGFVGDFDGRVGGFLSNLPDNDDPRLIIFLGGTIGNFTPEHRADFLRGIRSGMRSDDRLLLGLDLVKNTSTLEAAYDDAAGVTAAFNKNVLSVINYSLDAGFDPNLFSHRSTFDTEHKRIEMWLDSLEEQRVHLGVPGFDVHFSSGEGIRTEISAKFTSSLIEQMFEGSGLSLVDLFSDENDLFGLALAKPL